MKKEKTDSYFCIRLLLGSFLRGITHVTVKHTHTHPHTHTHAHKTRTRQRQLTWLEKNAAKLLQIELLQSFHRQWDKDEPKGQGSPSTPHTLKGEQSEPWPWVKSSFWMQVRNFSTP